MSVYFIQAGGVAGEIKIGAASDEPRPETWASPIASRLIAIEKERGLRAEVLAVTPGHLFVERWFHRRHVADRLRGEWFAPSDALLLDVAALAAGERVAAQPEQPPRDACFPARLARHYRQQLFRIDRQEMAEALGLSVSSLAQGECADGASILRAIDYEIAARRFGVPLTLARIVSDALATMHRARYREHIVTSPSHLGGNA